jgi:hypothetical protein
MIVKTESPALKTHVQAHVLDIMNGATSDTLLLLAVGMKQERMNIRSRLLCFRSITFETNA